MGTSANLLCIFSRYYFWHCSTLFMGIWYDQQMQFFFYCVCLSSKVYCLKKISVKRQMLVKVNIFKFFIIFIIRGQLNPYIEDVLSRIQDLLVLNTPDNGYQHLLSNEDQLFIYETAGSLIVSSSLSPEVSECF